MNKEPQHIYYDDGSHWFKKAEAGDCTETVVHQGSKPQGPALPKKRERIGFNAKPLKKRAKKKRAKRKTERKP